MKYGIRLNFRNALFAIAASIAIVFAIFMAYYAIIALDAWFSQFVMSNFRTGTLTRIRYVLPLALIAVFALIRSIAIRTRLIEAPRAAEIESRIECIFAAALPLMLSLAIGIAFASWFPHYLYWPWWMDLEHFAMSARMWDEGIRPYRDLIDFNFPGPIYLMWGIGKIFGWGRPMIANAIDGIFVAAICAVVIEWSRRRLGSSVPGLFAVFLIARYYFSLDYSRVMQRDWYVAGLTVAAICLVQSRLFKNNWFVAGTLLAIAGCLRPYAILSAGPVVAALWWECEPGFRNRWKEIVRLIAFTSFGSILLWMPLVAHEILDDFVRTFVSEALRGSYGSKVPESLADMLWRQLDTKIVFTGFVGLTVASIANRDHSVRLRFVAVWFIAFLAMLFYMPMCPVKHAYTEIPVEIFACVACGIGLWVLLESRYVAPSVKIVVVAVWFAYQMPGWPKYCDFRASVHALADLTHWRTPVMAPPGCRSSLASSGQKYLTNFRWGDYQDTLRYIRDETDPETQVANFVWIDPFPTFNGPTGRRIVFPCGEGILWLKSVSPELEPRFAKALEEAHRSIVIKQSDSLLIAAPVPWPMIDATIRKKFDLKRIYGNFEVWIRKSENEEMTEESEGENEPGEKKGQEGRKRARSLFDNMGNQQGRFGC